MTTQEMTNLGIALGIIFAAYKFGPQPVKAAALGVAGVMIAQRIPYVKDAI